MISQMLVKPLTGTPDFPQAMKLPWSSLKSSNSLKYGVILSDIWVTFVLQVFNACQILKCQNKPITISNILFDKVKRRVVIKGEEMFISAQD